ncbi:MAG: hypothetical protein M0Q92_08700 [Methanoregula sp.]|jgi:hypothetical protein|nr:hypothetical protein [Methanoregula sp.]
MTSLAPEYRFFIALAAGTVLATAFLASPVWYLTIVLLVPVLAVLALARTRPDRGFYLMCSGMPLVIASAGMNIWAGLFGACILAGMVVSAAGFIESGEDMVIFALFCSGLFLVALLIELSNHVLSPLIIILGITGLVLAIHSVHNYQFRKHYSGG